jgi:hypothetical protein
VKTLTKLIAKSAIGGGALIGLGLLSAPAQAASLTYTFDSSFDNQSSVSQTVGGVTGTFSGINNSNTGKFEAGSGGIYLDNADSYGDQFNISFDQAVQFLSYSVTYSGIRSGRTGTFALSNPNGAASTGNNLASVGTFNFSNQFNLNAGQTSTLTATVPNGADTAQIQSITVDYTPTSAVPEPLTILGALTAAGFGAGFKRRRDQANKD